MPSNNQGNERTDQIARNLGSIAHAKEFRKLQKDVKLLMSKRHAHRGFKTLSYFTNNKTKAKKIAKHMQAKRKFIDAEYLLKDHPIMPQRSTDGSAGYDIRANDTVIVPSITRQLMMYSIACASHNKDAIWPVKKNLIGSKKYDMPSILKPMMVPTGIKAYCPKDETVLMFNRSSNPTKRGLILANSVGVIDSDYYNNPSNEGELLVALYEIGPKDYVIHRGDRIAQCVFAPFYLADNDKPRSKQRKGGWGSSGK